MSMPKRVFVTGATGFVGSHLAFELLREGNHVTALARGSKAASPRDRVIEVLDTVAKQAEGNGGLVPHMDRLAVLEGDISKASLGVNEELLRNVTSTTDETWHCA